MQADPTRDAATTSGTLDTSIGSLEFVDGVPSRESAAVLFDHLDLMHGVNAYLNCFAGPSTRALREGFREAGAEDNDVLIFSELMDSASLFLTANADTVYFVGTIDVSAGPMVVETPPGALGIFNDMWWGWIIDFGVPGPDRGEGGRFLLLPPGYDGPLPDSGFHVGHSATNRVLMLGRSFMEDDDPAPVAARIKDTLKIYPYTPGGFGTSIGTLLTGQVKPGVPAEPPPATKFVEASGRAFNTIPPSDFAFFEMLAAHVQDEPAESIDAERMGELAAIGIVKGKPFAPDARMTSILEQAAAIGAATSRALAFSPRASEGFAHYDGSAWQNMLFVGGYDFETPPPMVTKDGIQPFPPTGARTLHARTAFFYGYTGISPAMCMRLPGVGSQYLIVAQDAAGVAFDGARTYMVTLPPGIPAARFWSLTAYDTVTRSMLQTEQRFPRAGSQAYPTPAAVAGDDGSTEIVFAPALPDGVPASNWIQTVPGKGWFTILRLYSPLPPFFDRSWRPSEIEVSG